MICPVIYAALLDITKLKCWIGGLNHTALQGTIWLDFREQGHHKAYLNTLIYTWVAQLVICFALFISVSFMQKRWELAWTNHNVQAGNHRRSIANKEDKSLTGNNISKEGSYSSPSFQISKDEVHIWSASLEQPAYSMAEFFLLLSSDEKERSNRFYFEKDRNRFIAGRAILRTLLGNYLKMEPAQIKFNYGVYGKPALETRHNQGDLQFNLSHSNDEAAYIFNWDQPVGIDVEYMRPMMDMDDVALQFFTPNEYSFIQSLPKDQKQEFFFKLWTCKEAFLKANGSGLTVPINQVEVLLTTEGIASLTSIGSDQEIAPNWRLELFAFIKDYQASFAIQGHEKRVLFQRLDRHYQIK